MATYALIHGAGDSSFYWHLIEPELRSRGHDTISMDLPCDDDSAGLAEYADTVIEAIDECPNLIVVAQSFGAFTAPLVCADAPVGLLVLIAGMVPLPGERGEDWPTNTSYPGPQGTSEREIFYDDVPEDLFRAAIEHARPQSDTPGRSPWPLEAWPEVPTRYLLCREDRMFPAEWLRQVVRERLGIEPDEIDGGHCPALSRPRQLAEQLEAYRAELGLP